MRRQQKHKMENTENARMKNNEETGNIHNASTSEITGSDLQEMLLPKRQQVNVDEDVKERESLHIIGGKAT